MSHLVIAPVLLPLLAGVVLLLLRHVDLQLRRLLSVGAVLAELGLALVLLGVVSDGQIRVYALGDWPAPYGIVLVADRLSAWLLVTTGLLAFFALLYALRGIDASGRHFHVLFQLQLFGLAGAFLTGDLFNLFVFFEVLLLASYGLLLHGGGRLRTRAGLHYVVLNLTGSTLFLFAVGALYGVLGTLNMADLARAVAVTPAENVGVVRAAGLLLFGVFALKAALLPLHLWLPAAYANTSAPVAALFAIMTKVGAYSILRIDTLIFGQAAGPLAGLLDPWLLPTGLVTLAAGTLGAVGSRRLGTQVAYLVVASAGTLVTAFGLANPEGIAAGLYYLPHTTLAAAAAFLLTDAIARRRGELGDRLDPGPTLPEIRLVGGLFFIAAVALAGLPPLAGFLGKLLLLRAALGQAALPWVYAVVLGAGLLALIALARSGSLLFYRTQSAMRAVAGQPAAVAVELVPVAGLLALIVGLSVAAGSTVEYTQAAAAQLMQPDHYVQTVLGGGR